MPSVQDSAELRRILAIPRRVYSDADADRLVDLLTNALKTPHGTMRLMRHQAIALAEIAQYGGVFLPLPVGAGKTLISFLAPVVYASMRGHDSVAVLAADPKMTSRAVAAMGLPVLIVQEGGYLCPELGDNLEAVLREF